MSLPQIQWPLNNTINKTTGKTPAEILFSIRTTGISDAIMNDVVADAHQPLDVDQLRNEASNKITKEQMK